MVQWIVLVVALSMSLYYVLGGRRLAARPRRGTNLRLPYRGWLAVAALWLLVAVTVVLQLVTAS